MACFGLKFGSEFEGVPPPPQWLRAEHYTTDLISMISLIQLTETIQNTQPLDCTSPDALNNREYKTMILQ